LHKPDLDFHQSFAQEGGIMTSRRAFLKSAGLAGGAVAAGGVNRVALAGLPELVSQTSAATAAPLVPDTGRPYRPVVTLNGWSLPWRMQDGVKEFHLVAEPVVREMAPGMKAHLWGYNGQSPGPTIEVVEGDRVRIFVTNRLPEHTSVHWHGQRLPNGMDGVSGLTQPSIPSGKTFVYEFVARRPGTFMYHPHADEMVQMAMGMMGTWITHPKAPHPLIDEVDRDFVFLLNAYDIDPGSYTPRIMTMLDFNLWTWNSRVFPGIDSLNVRQNDKVRIRVGNLTMTNHPIHVHGHEFVVTGTDGGPTPRAGRWPEVSVDVAVGQMRQMEFVADEEGDWALHCHKSHHTMNAMGMTCPR
jgi:FtsP/CotA-like multicopper oxidase with cupredoxin domain